MPPNNTLVPTAPTDAANVGRNAARDQNPEPENNFLNRKSKNFLNTNESISKLDENANEIEPATIDDVKFKADPVWRNIIAFVFLHYWCLRGMLYSGFNLIFFFNVIVGISSGMGITAGAHRLWAHGAYKGNLPLRILLAFLQTLAFQNTIYEWVRDHRAHHKFTDTNADPHSASRGFFFAHMGWLLCKKHPDVKKYGMKVDMSDLDRDPVVAFQKKYFPVLMPLCHTVIPVVVFMWLFDLSFYQAFCMNMFRYVTVLHFTWLVNSYAHFFGSKPFDKNIKPTDSYTVSLLAFGEGWHNYHHVFPYDYKTSEHGKYWCNFTTGFIDFMKKIGWATDLKTINPEIILKRAMRTGDGSFVSSQIMSNDDISGHGTFDEHIWGWQDQMVTADEKLDVTIINKTE